MSEDIALSYDVVPYESDTHKITRPDHLATIAHLFGVAAPDFRKARVLELGCAGGGNLVPMAAIFPESQFVGIDLSAGHIDDAQKLSSAIGLTNTDFRCLSISDVDASFGTFDYIIAHGVYAWVPEEVRSEIFAICNNHLTPNGLAYISYNTLPGWNMIKTVRDMMIYHAEQFDEPQRKIHEARQVIQFAAKNSVASDPIYKQMLEREVKTLSEGSDDYVFHDHLAKINSPSYFRDFMETAAAEGLQYLGDCNLASMYLGNFSEQARNILGEITDIVRQEQYLDFLTNRRFRQTILCRAGVPIDRGITPDRLESLYFTTQLRPIQGIESVDLSVDAPTEFRHPTASTYFTSSNRVIVTAFCVLAEQHGLPLCLEDLVTKICERLVDVPNEAARESFLKNTLNLMLSGMLDVGSDPGCHTAKISDRPEVWPYARYLARVKSYIPNVLHEADQLGDDFRAMLPYADGTRTHDEITNDLMTHFLDGRLSFHLDGNPITEKKTLAEPLKNHVQAMLKFLAARAYLVG